MAVAFLRESQQTQELWFKSQGWQGTQSPPHLLLLPDCMFTARLMKFLSAPNLQWYWHIKSLVLLLPPPLSVLCLSSLRANALRKSNTHSWPLPPPVNPSLHVRIPGLCLLIVPLPIYNVAGCAVVSCVADHACVA